MIHGPSDRILWSNGIEVVAFRCRGTCPGVHRRPVVGRGDMFLKMGIQGVTSRYPTKSQTDFVVIG